MKAITQMVRNTFGNLKWLTGQGDKIEVPPVIHLVADTMETCKTHHFWLDYTSVASTGSKYPDDLIVPDGEIWIIHYIHARLSTGVWTLDRIVVKSPTKNYDPNPLAKPSTELIIQIDTGGGLTDMWWPGISSDYAAPKTSAISGFPLKLTEGWLLGASVDGYTSTGNLEIRFKFDRIILK